MAKDDKKKKKTRRILGNEELVPGLFSEQELAGFEEVENLSDGAKSLVNEHDSKPDFSGKSTQEQVGLYEKYTDKLLSELRHCKSKYADKKNQIKNLQRELEVLTQTIKSLKKDHAIELRKIESQIEDSDHMPERYQRELEALENEKLEWKTKIQHELRRIKLKDKELENKYELLKRDSQALLDTKDEHILELKKVINQSELDLENADEKLLRNARILSLVGSKKSRLIETLQLAIGLLENLDREEDHSQQPSKKVGT